MEDIERIKQHREKLNLLKPTYGKRTKAGKIERIKFAVQCFDAPLSCTNLEMNLVDKKEKCKECATNFISIICQIIDGNGLPGERE